MTESKKRGLYIHIPFCVKKCEYCAFLSFNAESSPRKEYTDALVNEIKIRAEELEHPVIDTVYVGGGTPSVLDISQMRDIMHAVKTSFEIRPDAEITIEANPGTLGRKDGVTLAKLQAYKYMGFNRISMGVQSMDNNRLHFMGRIHTAENVKRDMQLIRSKGFENVNLDLIFSVPGESTEDALSDLREIIALGPEHVSCYSLQIEEGTPFCRMIEAGELKEVPDEEDRKTYHAVCSMLKEAGYEHYEISNFARLSPENPGDDAPGRPSPYRSRHNSLYWDMSDYIGVGLGASGFVGGRRYRNTTDIDEYIEFYGKAGTGSEADAEAKAEPETGSGALPLCEDHQNTAFDNISEAVFTGLRRIEGITYEEALAAYCRASETAETDAADSADIRTASETAADAFWSIFSDAESEARDYEGRGLLVIDDKGLKLTEKGIDISNSIMALFV